MGQACLSTSVSVLRKRLRCLWIGFLRKRNPTCPVCDEGISVDQFPRTIQISRMKDLLKQKLQETLEELYKSNHEAHQLPMYAILHQLQSSVDKAIEQLDFKDSIDIRKLS